jgi:hypothetical protein
VTRRLSVIPMWAEALSDPVSFWPGRFEELERHLEQINNLHFSQLPERVLGLSAIAQWIGQVRNGGTSQYFVNCLFNTFGFGAYTKNLVSETIIVLEEIGNKEFIEIYIDTLRTFSLEVDFHLNPPSDSPFYRSPRNEILDNKVLSIVDVLHSDYYKYSKDLGNMKFFNDAKFDDSVKKLIDESGLVIDENCNSDRAGIEVLNFAELDYDKEDVISGKIHPKVAYDDVMAAKFSIGLKNSVTHINDII